MVSKKVPPHASHQVKKESKEKQEKHEGKNCDNDCHDGVQVVNINFTSPDLQNKKKDMLEQMEVLHNDLEMKIYSLYERLSAATTTSNELKDIMMQELRNLVSAKNRVNGVRTSVLARMFVNVFGEEDTANISAVYVQKEDISKEEKK
jgi:hypothetical protein